MLTKRVPLGIGDGVGIKIRMAKLSLAKLERHLYAAADRLRQEGLDAATYKDYIFGMLFLKRCSDVFDAEREKIVGGKVEQGMIQEVAETQYGENADFYDLNVARKFQRNSGSINKQYVPRRGCVRNRCPLGIEHLDLPVACPRTALASLITAYPQRFWIPGRLRLYSTAALSFSRAGGHLAVITSTVLNSIHVASD